MARTPARFVKDLFVGKPRDLADRRVFHRVSLIAIFAWVGLGADGLSSSCYGPEEAFKALGQYHHLAVFVAIAAVATVLIISASYSQIIDLFPGGGGGYVVASKLLSPTAGVVSGSALIIDYVLTISISIAGGADAVFSLMPVEMQAWKVPAGLGAIGLLTLLNLRGVKESVLPLVPVFFTFLLTHAVVIVYALVAHAGDLGSVASNTVSEVRSATSTLGVFGLLMLLLRAYSTGAGTYTGIEAVSNGLPILREPKAQTGKRTMRYMAISLASTVAGLLVGYLLYRVEPVPGKTLNAVLFESVTGEWHASWSFGFVLVALAAEAALLFVAAQAGFIDGPRVLANMAVDRWFPTRFATLSDRLVNQNGILLMSGAALAVLWLTGGSVGTLVVLYSINVFITFSMSQLAMIRHWHQVRRAGGRWRRGMAINGVGFCLTSGILISMTAVKFHEGGWITVACTSALVALAFLIRRHYRNVSRALARLDRLVGAVERTSDTDGLVRSHNGVPPALPGAQGAAGDRARTAVLLVNGFNGLGLHTLLAIMRSFAGTYDRFVFLSIGVVDAGNFKGVDEIERLRAHVRDETNRYVRLMHRHGYEAEGVTDIGTDAVDSIIDHARDIATRYPGCVFFGGQIVFPRETFLTRLLHNSVVSSVQHRLCREGLPFMVLPVRLE
jgi:hypothetical protein